MKIVYKYLFPLVLAITTLSLEGCIFIQNTETISNTPTEENESYVKIDSILSNLSDVDYDTEGYVSVSKDEIFSQWPQANNALTDTHGDVIKITYYDKNNTSKQWSTSSFSIEDVYSETESYLVFDYKTSFSTNCYVKQGDQWVYTPTPKPYESESIVRVYVDDELQPVKYGSMGNSIWRTTGIKLSPDEDHTVKWEVPVQEYYFNNVQNCLYLDNFRLVSAADYETIDLSPKGKQETFINKPITFTAQADWSNSTPVYSVDNGGSITDTGIFTATKPGTYTVTATIDGKTACNSTVTVYDANSFNTPVTTAGHTFNGKLQDTSKFPCNNKYQGAIELKAPSPDKYTFDADGFFVMSGTVLDTEGKYYICVLRDDDKKQNYFTCYPISGDFTLRIWLRFGDGLYNVCLGKIENDGKLWWKGYTYQVNCTSGITLDQALFTLPSAIVNSDSFEISNAVHDALYGYEEATEGKKLQLIHDWIQHHYHYDYVSIDNSKRKSQYAEFCINAGMAVCEGYANTFAAMARYINIPCSVICSSAEDMNHAWNEVMYNNEWKLVDVTWDDGAYDPDNSTDNTSKYPYEENYTYFLIERTGKNNDHVDKYYQNAVNRALKGETVELPYYTDMPNGWY